MWTDVLDLNEFYSSTQGQMTVRLLRARLREVWPNVRGETVLGLGYATPFLRPFREEAARTLAFMPAQQGVTRWPREGANHTALVDEMDLPLPDRSAHYPPGCDELLRHGQHRSDLDARIAADDRGRARCERRAPA